MNEEEQEKLYDLLFKDTKNKLEATIEKQQEKIKSLESQLDFIGEQNKHIDKQQKEIEEWQKAYIRENNYWLKFRNKINKIANNDKDCSDNAVIKAVKNLKKENDKLTKLLLGKSLGFNDYIKKDKIREKLNKLKEEQKEYKGSQEWEIQDDILAQIMILEELLEE